MAGPPDYRVADRDAITTILGTWTPTPAPTSNWLGVALPNRKLAGLPAGQDAPTPKGDMSNPVAFLYSFTVKYTKVQGGFEFDPFPPRWGCLYVAFAGEIGAGEGVQELAASSLVAALQTASTPLLFFDADLATTRTEGDYDGWHVLLLQVTFNASGGGS